jgi:hypothetical protein
MKNTTLVGVLFTAEEVAKFAGIDSFALQQLHPDHFGSPGHWRMHGGTVLYTAKGIEGLLVGLQKAGNAAGVEALLAELHSRQVELAQQQATPSRALLEPVAKSTAVPYFRQGQYE